MCKHFVGLVGIFRFFLFALPNPFFALPIFDLRVLMLLVVQLAASSCKSTNPASDSI